MSWAGKRMQEWLKENLPEVWEKPRNKIEGLIQKMKVVMWSLDRGTMAKAYLEVNVQGRGAVVAADIRDHWFRQNFIISIVA